MSYFSRFEDYQEDFSKIKSNSKNFVESIDLHLSFFNNKKNIKQDIVFTTKLPGASIPKVVVIVSSGVSKDKFACFSEDEFISLLPAGRKKYDTYIFSTSSVFKLIGKQYSDEKHNEIVSTLKKKFKELASHKKIIISKDVKNELGLIEMGTRSIIWPKNSNAVNFSIGNINESPAELFNKCCSAVEDLSMEFHKLTGKKLSIKNAFISSTMGKSIKLHR